MGAGPAGRAELAGSAHDFSGEAWSGGDPCVVCHTPHGALQDESEAPLWNHELTGASFRLYASPTLNATLEQPAGVTRLCLSCHDGTVALDSFGGRTGNEMIGAAGRLGSDLSDDHPVGFVFDDNLAQEDGGLHPPSSTPSGLGRTIAQDLLRQGRLECTSCHDVHNSSNQPHLLVMSNRGSALCLTCHRK
ncbi:MAG: cytochrome C [Verrucomicrobia bacterium]|nr:MAG: cytochrome C [Verrucomicrobiota bacterium]